MEDKGEGVREQPEGLPGIVLLADKGLNIVEWERGLEGLTGLSPSELLGAPLSRLFASNADWLRGVEERGRIQAESRLLLADGGSAPYLLSIDTHFAGGFRVTGLDISGRKEAEERLVEAMAELEARHNRRGLELEALSARLRQVAARCCELEGRLEDSQRLAAMGEIAAAVAHDLNNLMVILKLTSAMALKKAAAGEDPSQFLEQVAQASGRAEELAGELLLFSRRTGTRPGPIDLNALVAGTMGLLKRAAGAKAALKARPSVRLSLVMGDRWSIEQLLVGLVLNARDALGTGGGITIATAEANGHVELSVEAAREGGLEEAGDWAEAFKTNGVSRLPLGLAPYAKIVRGLDGRIEVGTGPAGVRFTVRLNAIQGSNKEEQKEESPVEHPGRGESVLVVEDERLLRRSVAVVLSSNGYKVIEASSATEALRLFEEDPGVSLVFSDLVLQDMDGLSLVDELKRRKPGFKVLMTSGYLDVESQWPAVRERGIRFLQKPYEIPDLLKSVRAAMESD